MDPELQQAFADAEPQRRSTATLDQRGVVADALDESILADTTQATDSDVQLVEEKAGSLHTHPNQLIKESFRKKETEDEDKLEFPETDFQNSEVMFASSY